jgi:hypothetical protein
MDSLFGLLFLESNVSSNFILNYITGRGFMEEKIIQFSNWAFCIAFSCVPGRYWYAGRQQARRKGSMGNRRSSPWEEIVVYRFTYCT